MNHKIAFQTGPELRRGQAATKQKKKKKMARKNKKQKNFLSQMLKNAKRIPDILAKKLLSRRRDPAGNLAIIGVSVSYEEKKKFYGVYSRYTKAVEKAGGIPLMLPVLNKKSLKEVLKHIDGLLISGGFSLLDARKYKKNRFPSLRRMSPGRYKFDAFLIKKALKMQLPILAICRGMQMLNEVSGGTTGLSIPSKIEHNRVPGTAPTHFIRLREGTKLKRIFGKDKLFVNSTHQHCINKIARGFKASARAYDGVIEAIEGKKHYFVVGIQFHPEKMIKKHPAMLAVFKAFVEAAVKRRQTKKLKITLMPVTKIAETARQVKKYEQKYLRQKKEIIRAGGRIEKAIRTTLPASSKKGKEKLSMRL